MIINHKESKRFFKKFVGRKVEQWKNRNVLWPRIKGKTCLHNVSAFTVKSHHVYAAKSNITQVEQIFHIVWTSTAELTGQGKLFFFEENVKWIWRVTLSYDLRFPVLSNQMFLNFFFDTNNVTVPYLGGSQISWVWLSYQGTVLSTRPKPQQSEGIKIDPEPKLNGGYCDNQ